MDFEFREPTEEESEYIVRKTMENTYDDDPVLFPSFWSIVVNGDRNTKTEIVIMIVSISVVIMAVTIQMGLENVIDLLPLFIFGAVFYFVIIFSVYWNKKAKQQVEAEKERKLAEKEEARMNGMARISSTEARNRIINAKLKVADVTLVRSEKIATDKDDAYYIEVVDVNSVIGNTVEMHATKGIYDGFEEGKEAYVVWWDYANSSIGADAWEIMFKNDI